MKRGRGREREREGERGGGGGGRAGGGGAEEEEERGGRSEEGLDLVQRRYSHRSGKLEKQTKREGWVARRSEEEGKREGKGKKGREEEGRGGISNYALPNLDFSSIHHAGEERRGGRKVVWTRAKKGKVVY